MPLINYATGGLVPDLTVLLDVDVEVGLERAKKAGREWNRMDAQPNDFHERVKEGYYEIVKNDPLRWIVVDANADKEEVFNNLITEIEKRLILDGILTK